MSLRIISKAQQAYGAFNGGQIIENKPIGFPQDGGFVRPFSNLFYWARAEAVVDSTIGLHPHRGFEIMSFVLEGRIRHFDSKTNVWLPLEAGSVQIIRAGNGIQHAEHMEQGAVMFQIWTDPDLSRTLQQEATYSDYPADVFPSERVEAVQKITHIGDGSPFTLDTADLEVTRWSSAGEVVRFTEDVGYIRALYVIKGSGTVNGQTLEQDDFVIAEEEALDIDPNGEMDLFVIRCALRPDYQTYADSTAKV